MITAVLRFFFDHAFGPLAAGAIGLLVLVGAYQLNANHHRAQGARNAVETVNRKAQGIAREAREARRAADAPGAVERLRRDYCGDC